MFAATMPTKVAAHHSIASMMRSMKLRRRRGAGAVAAVTARRCYRPALYFATVLLSESITCFGS